MDNTKNDVKIDSKYEFIDFITDKKYLIFLSITSSKYLIEKF